MSKATIMKGVLLLVLGIGLAGPSYAQNRFEEALGIEKKYYLKDCMVKLNLEWPPATTSSVLERVGNAIDFQIRNAIVSGEFPLISSDAPWNLKYYVFYYVDQCEHRRQLVEALVEKYLVPHIPEFPEYHIEDEGLEPGFDGVMPQCCWLDDEQRGN